MAHATIIANLDATYASAKTSGALHFYESTTHIHVENEVEYEIRLCPALQKKPPMPTPHFDLDAVFDPFDNPEPGLVVGELKGEDVGGQSDYHILLNKYSVVPGHFMLVTKDYQSQSSPLLPDDLVHAYLLIKAARDVGRDVFAFFNCGERSGASQPHKHIQFLPIPNREGPPIERVARRQRPEREELPFAISRLPYAHHILRLPSFPSSSTPQQLADSLGQAFLNLLDALYSTVRHAPDYPPGTPSYNVLLTMEHIHIIPRVQEKHELLDGERIAVNALGFAGMLLVKSEGQLEAVKREKVEIILRGVALPKEESSEGEDNVVS